MTIKEIIEFLPGTKNLIENWNELEAWVGKPCTNLESLFKGIINKIEYIDSIGQGLKIIEEDNKINPKNNNGFHIVNDSLENDQNKLKEVNNTLKANNDFLSEDNKHLATKVEELEKKLNDENKKDNAIIKILMEITDYLDRMKFDTRLTTENVFQNIEAQTEEVLLLLNVKCLKETGGVFDSKCQIAVTIEDTDDISKNNIVCESLRKGFKKGDLCIKEQKVIVCKYNKDRNDVLGN